jgi:alkaline phosphatase D
MGQEQEAWLAQGLDNQARWNLIAQQVLLMPLVRRAADGTKLQPSTDSWNGYPASRARLVKTITDRKLTNVVVASGDAHVNWIGTVPVRDDEPDGPAAATEFLCTSISSEGDGLPMAPSNVGLREANPNLALTNNQRGYHLFDVTAKEWRTEVKIMDRVLSRGGDISSLARFAVMPDQPRLHKL